MDNLLTDTKLIEELKTLATEKKYQYRYSN